MDNKNWKRAKEIKQALKRDWQAMKQERALSSDEVIESDVVDLILFFLIKKGVIK